MTKIHALLVGLIMTLFLAMVPGTALADNHVGTYWAIHNQGDSDAWLDVELTQYGSFSDHEINLLPGHTAGEPSYEDSLSEANFWYHRAGWCSKWKIDNGPLHYEPLSSIGYWVSVFEGFGDISGTHMTYVKTWNC